MWLYSSSVLPMPLAFVYSIVTKVNRRHPVFEQLPRDKANQDIVGSAQASHLLECVACIICIIFVCMDGRIDV